MNKKVIVFIAVIFAIVLGGFYYLNQQKSIEKQQPIEEDAKVMDGLCTFSLPSGWQSGPRECSATNKAGNSMVELYPGSGSFLTGVIKLDQENIDNMKTEFAKIYPGSVIKSEDTTIGSEQATIVSLTGSRDGTAFFWTSSFFMHKGILYTIIFNSTDSISRAMVDFQKIISSFQPN